MDTQEHTFWSGSIFILPPYTREKNHLDNAEIEPGSPAPQASTLSIMPSPLRQKMSPPPSSNLTNMCNYPRRLFSFQFIIWPIKFCNNPSPWTIFQTSSPAAAVGDTFQTFLPCQIFQRNNNNILFYFYFFAIFMFHTESWATHTTK